MNYVLAVKSPVYGKQGAFLAYQFAQALLEKGHVISQIFFFQDGVSNGNGLVYPAYLLQELCRRNLLIAQVLLCQKTILSNSSMGKI